MNQIRQHFVTTDGKRHPSEAAANAHQALVDAEAEAKAATARYHKLLAESCRTADGHRFRVSYSTTYYVVKFPLGRPPYVEHATVGYDYRVRLNDGRVELVAFKPDRGKPMLYRRHQYQPSELYAKEKNALAKLREHQLTWWLDSWAKMPAQVQAKVLAQAKAGGLTQ